MSTQNKNPVVGDVVKYESPHALCRESRHVTMVAAATLPLVVGEMMEPDGAVVHVDTMTCALTANGGSYRLGYEGQWTTVLPQGTTLGDAKIAFELLTTVIATGHGVTFSAAPDVTATTCTWSATGRKSLIQVDARLLTATGVSMEGDVVWATTQQGTAVVDMVECTTGANVTGVLMEEVSLVDLQTKDNIERSFLIGSDGVAIVDGDQLFGAADEAAAIAIIDGLAGINVRYEPNILTSGTPEDSLP